MVSNKHLSSFSFCIAWIWESRNWVILALSLSWDYNQDLCNHLKSWLWLEDLFLKLVSHVSAQVALDSWQHCPLSLSDCLPQCPLGILLWPLCEWVTEKARQKSQCLLFYFIFISWRLITLQYCSGFCHTLTWLSHGYTCIPHPDPPSHLPLHPIPLGLPSAPGPSTCLMHPTWAGDLFLYR